MAIPLTSLFVLAGIAGVSLYVASPQTPGSDKNDHNPQSRRNQYYKDFREIGIPYEAQKTSYLNLVNINDDYKPYSAPRQKPTDKVTDVAWDQADIHAWAGATIPQFYFRNDHPIPISSTELHTVNVQVPGIKSFRGDTKAHLTKLPRTYINKERGMYAGDKLTQGAMGSSESEVWTEMKAPRMDYHTFQMNPYGPGGQLQNLQNWSDSNKVKKRPNRAKIVAPPQFAKRSHLLSVK